MYYIVHSTYTLGYLIKQSKLNELLMGTTALPH
uniref:Uncharacterized protein n=1 Tax=Anguilla anguilla TaxID=7936 RepID=A0A0E9SND6_ANGAN